VKLFLLGEVFMLSMHIYSFWAHPFCLCLAMIVWLVTREQMLFQVIMARH